MSEQNIVVTLPQKLLAIQAKIGAVTKSSTNPHFRSTYADLNEVLGVVKPALNEMGIVISQGSGADAYGKYLETSLIDSTSGQHLSGRVYFSGNEDNMQKIGAAITYARRFGLVSLLALESEDDDGETAVGRPQAQIQNKSNTGEQRVVKATAVAGVRGESKAAVPAGASGAGTSRKALLEKISLTAKVLVDSKRVTSDDVVKLLGTFGVTKKEELTDTQAASLLTQLQEKLK